jgi:hypothetical protein
LAEGQTADQGLDQVKVQILEAAMEDLTGGYRFYEKQSAGVWDYSLDSLFSDIDSLQVYGGIHAAHFDYHRLLFKRFPFADYYTPLRYP